MLGERIFLALTFYEKYDKSNECINECTSMIID
jgi:hypothetical protein